MTRPNPARKALSAIYRTGERFGSGYVIDVLIGKPDERIQRNGHDKLSTFGIGKDVGVNEWKSLFRQMAVAGLIHIAIDDHMVIRLTPECRPLLRGEVTFRLRRHAVASSGGGSGAGSARKEKRAGPKRATAGIRAEDKPLANELRALRTKLATEGNVPPYVIFPDVTLAELALMRPRNRDELKLVTGMGEARIGRYGEALLALIGKG